MSIQDLVLFEEEKKWKENRIAARRAEREDEDAAKKLAVTDGEQRVLDIYYNRPAEVIDADDIITIRNVEAVLPNEEGAEVWVDDDENDGDLKIMLTNSLMLLQDCNNLMINIIDPLLRDRISTYMHQEIVRISAEVSEFLKDVDTGSVAINAESSLYD